MARRVSEPAVKAYERQRYDLQQTRAEAARTAAVTQEWARLHDNAIKAGTLARRPTSAENRVRKITPVSSGASLNPSSGLRLAAPINFDALCDEARRAYEDFEYFRRRYFGRQSMPWAVDAMHRLDELMRSPEREYVVINVAPGVGKSTLLHDFAVWETVKHRWIRGLWGSATAQLAGIATKRLRSTLGASYAIKAKQRDLAAGYGQDAEATLVADYGRFRPVDGGVWRTDMFVVEQFDAENYDEKEPTWGAFGQNSEEIGWRANLILWDDLVTKSLINATLDAIDRHREWFDDVAEERLEPGGLFGLIGQRLGPNDTYRYCLDKMTDEVTFEGADTYDVDTRTPMYAHIVYPAHDAAVCKGHDKADPKQVKAAEKPWRPDGKGGCLIDPYRISWKKCRDTMRDEQKWETVYQQGDSSAQDVLVQKLWIDGGMDNRTGEMFIGCWDEHRSALEIPEGEGLVSYMVVDPSPSRYWGILWMAYDPTTLRRYVLDVHREKMQAGEFLDVIGGKPVGLAHEWVVRSHALGLPIKAMVVEANSAERFLLQYEHVRQWMSRYGVRVLSHQTHANKADPNFGVQTIAGIWRQGLVRLPGKSRLTVKPLVAEATTYPQGASDDLVMAFWFGEYNLRVITQKINPEASRRPVPTWLRRDAMVGAA